MKKKMTTKIKLNNLVGEHGLFYYLNQEKTFPFDVVTPETLDTSFTLDCGNMFLTQNVSEMFIEKGSDETLKLLAKMLSGLYSEKWKKVYDAFNTDYPLNVSSRSTISEDTNNDTTNTHNVSAYDSDDLISDNSDTNNGKKTRDYTRETISLKSLTNNIELFTSTVIYGIMFKDVKENIFSFIQ